jgi:hypothetical protein
MALGPGKYDDLTTRIREETGADAVVLLVLGGNRGHGFSVQAIPPTFPAIVEALRKAADQIKRDAQAIAQEPI